MKSGKYAVDLIPVKSEKLWEKFCVSYDTDTNHSLKCFHNSLCHLKPIPHFILMLPIILAGATKAK